MDVGDSQGQGGRRRDFSAYAARSAGWAAGTHCGRDSNACGCGATASATAGLLHCKPTLSPTRRVHHALPDPATLPGVILVGYSVSIRSPLFVLQGPRAQSQVVCAPQGGRGFVSTFAAAGHSQELHRRKGSHHSCRLRLQYMLRAPAVRLRCRLPPMHVIASPVAWFPFAPDDKLVLQRVVRRFATAGLPRAHLQWKP